MYFYKSCDWHVYTHVINQDEPVDMRFRFFIFFVLLSTLTLKAFAQKNQIDSLKKAIVWAKTDSQKIEALYEYMKAAINDNTSEMEPYLKEMIRLSKKINFKWGLSTGYLLGLAYYKNVAKFEIAFLYADSAEVLVKSDTSRDIRLNKGHLFNNRGNLYYRLGDYDKAAADYLAGEKIFRELDNKSVVAVTNGLSLCYQALDMPDKALEYSSQAIDYARNFDDKRLLATQLMNRASYYSDVNNYSSADSILKEAWKLVKDLDNDKSFYVYYLNAGDVEDFYHKNPKRAMEYYRKALHHAKIVGEVNLQVTALIALADCQQLNGDKDFITTLKTLHGIVEENNMIPRWPDVYDLYAGWYEKQGDYKKAYEYYRLFKTSADKLSSDNVKNKIAMLEARFRVDNMDRQIIALRDEKQIQQLQIQHKNTVNSVLVMGIVALILIGGLGYRTYHQKQRLQKQRISELETEQQLSAAKAVLKGEEQERARLAKDLHDGLSGMLSGIKYSLQDMKGNLIMTEENQRAFERSMDMLDSSIQEMRRVAHNMMPEVLVRYGLDAALRDYIAEINKAGIIKVVYQSMAMEHREIEKSSAIAIYRIVQELLNNIIKHAKATEALVQLLSENERLVVNVEDNGKGFDTKMSEEKGGMGWRNIRSRVELLNGKIDLQSSSDHGTSVNIEFGLPKG